jgi:hypothetical protein
MRLLRERSQIELNLTSVVILAVAGGVAIEVPGRQRLQEWLHPPLEVSQFPGQGWTVSSMRDQIEAIVLGTRIDIKDHSGSRDFSKLSVAVATVLDITKLQSQAYGINFEMPLPVEFGDSPGLFVARHMLNYDQIDKVAPVRSATVDVRFVVEDMEIGLAFRPRTQPDEPVGLVLSANAHHDTDIRSLTSSGAPFQSALQTRIHTTLERVLDLVECL